MTKQQEWRRISHLRGIIKDRQTRIIKDQHGNKKGGIILTDETIKPYVRELEALEAKMAKDKEQMTTNERVDDAAEDVKANNDANTAELKAYIDTKFEKLNPKKFKNQINKWAYIQAKGSGDHYKTPEGKYVKRLGDIPPGCIFIHKVRVQEKVDDELDMYKYFHEDGTVGSAIGWDSFDFITLIGQRIKLKENAPIKVRKYVGIAGVITNEPNVKKIPKDIDLFTLEFPGAKPVKVQRQFLEFLDEPLAAEQEEEDQHKEAQSKATRSTSCPSDDHKDSSSSISSSSSSSSKSSSSSSSTSDSKDNENESTGAEPAAPACLKAEDEKKTTVDNEALINELIDMV
jgi:hypothetical protein